MTASVNETLTCEGLAGRSLVLGDDQGIFLDALSTVLAQRGYRIGAAARSSAEMMAFVRSQQPDACLIDCLTVGDDGIGKIGRVLAASQRTRVLMLAADPDAGAAARAIEAGAAGYLHQSRGIDALVLAIGRVMQGELVVDVPAVPSSRRPRAVSYAHRLAASLTSRERECLAMLVAGLDTETMVAELGVARTTVRTHLQSVLAKLGVHSRLEAASFAVRHRLAEAWPQEAAADSVPPQRRPGSAASPAAWAGDRDSWARPAGQQARAG
jgi:two-component system, NarL family, nitrate/nitrite response regulator NarL